MDQEILNNENHELDRKPLQQMSNKWREFIFQFFMLFLAIVCGFFAENLREEYSEKKQAEQYAKALVSDIARDVRNMQYHVGLLQKKVKVINELADYVRDKSLNDIKNIELYKLTTITPNTPYRWSRAALEQIKSSGSLRFFTNDSIDYYVSQYDAWTTHLDQDNLQDQEKFLNAFEKKVLVVDSNYPNDFATKMESNPDSVMKTQYYKEMASSKSLLANSLNEVKSMVAAYLIVKDNYVGRINELNQLLRDQERLILLLKREYGWQ